METALQTGGQASTTLHLRVCLILTLNAHKERSAQSRSGRRKLTGLWGAGVVVFRFICSLAQQRDPTANILLSPRLLESRPHTIPGGGKGGVGRGVVGIPSVMKDRPTQSFLSWQRARCAPLPPYPPRPGHREELSQPIEGEQCRGTPSLHRLAVDGDGVCRGRTGRRKVASGRQSSDKKGAFCLKRSRTGLLPSKESPPLGTTSYFVKCYYFGGGEKVRCSETGVMREPAL